MKSLFIVLIAAIFAFGCAPANSTDGRANIAANHSNSTPSVSPIPSATIPNPTSTPIADRSPLPPDAPGAQAAIDVVKEYYSAINAREYRKAYELWSRKGEASGQTFEEFRDGFADTESVEVSIKGEPGRPEGAAGSQYIEIPALIDARSKDGTTQKFIGRYTMRRVMADGATPEQRLWRIYSADVKKL